MGVATYLVHLIASLLRPVIYHPNMILFDDDTEPLLTAKFWVRPVFQELLHAASRFNLSQEAEFKPLISNLVKVASHLKVRYQTTTHINPLSAPISEWIGAECPIHFLNVWFPAHWAPLVFQAIQQKGEQHRKDYPMWFDAPAQDTDSAKLRRERAEAIQSRKLHFQKGKIASQGDIPTLMGKLKVDWIDLPVDDIMQQFGTLKEGILRGVFGQKAAAAWFGVRGEKAQITVILQQTECRYMVGENTYNATWVAEKYHHWQIPDGPATTQGFSSLSEVYQGLTSMAFSSTRLGTAQDPYGH